MSVEKNKLPVRKGATPAQIPLTPTAEHERNARRLACFVNDPTAPKLVRNALLSFLSEAAEVTRTPVLYAGEDELQVSPRNLAFMLCVAQQHDLDFQRGGIVDSEGNYLQRREIASTRLNRRRRKSNE